MCGIAGIIGSPLPPRSALERMRDAMTHRGPDDAGTWIGPEAAIVHRRLAVIDPSQAGHQPMTSPDGRFVLAYNGEIYNHTDLRQKLSADHRHIWHSACDTETLLDWLADRRPLTEVRGMYAFALIDTIERTLTLARDPLGIKPLFWARLPGRVLFASEPQALFQHPDFAPEPDPLGVSLYLSSVRTVMGRQTLFKGVHAVDPGQTLTFDLDDPALAPRSDRIQIATNASEPTADELRVAIDDAVATHLRSDVSLCAMLSGGLDSTIIVGTARERLERLRTYCAGVDKDQGDPQHATEIAAEFNTAHSTALLDEHTFASMWADTIARTGMPLATPNEVAIRLIARTLRADAQTVTLSGEGADELFAGYDAPLTASLGRTATISGGQHELEANAWIPDDIKQLLLVGEIAAAAADASALIHLYESAFEHANRGGDPSGPQSHLRFQRAVNLPMLLHRLDTATMLESVEGRTPFADIRVAELAAAIPFDRLFNPQGTTPGTRTKLALREAFAGRVPRAALERSKASFPVPFERWMSGLSPLVRESSAGQSIFQPAMIAALAEAPSVHWHLAWPVFNLVLWAERWWGRGLDDAIADQARAASTRGTAPNSRFV
jgi:asparagine synthase (glutamine-hydrolysing)